MRIIRADKKNKVMIYLLIYGILNIEIAHGFLKFYVTFFRRNHSASLLKYFVTISLSV